MKTSKLVFKGDATKKKKRKRAPKVSKSESESEKDDIGWIVCRQTDSVSGPLMILSKATDRVSVLCAHTQLNTVAFRQLSEEEASSDDVKSIEPSEVAQVFVAQKLPGSEKYSLKSAFDKFLGVDKFGEILCEKEAVGPAEEWEIIGREDGFAIRSVYDKFIKIDMKSPVKSHGLGTPMAEIAQGSSKLLNARCDSDSAGFLESFVLKCQKAHVVQMRAKEKEKTDVEYELDQMYAVSLFV
jgi:protein FRG1